MGWEVARDRKKKDLVHVGVVADVDSHAYSGCDHRKLHGMASSAQIQCAVPKHSPGGCIVCAASIMHCFVTIIV